MSSPSTKTIKTLYALSGNMCAFPGCNTRLVDKDSEMVLGKICHIKAKSPGGPRYDPLQTDKERDHHSNLILLCGNHHDVIDQQVKSYDCETLIQMKAVHEQFLGREAKSSDTAFAKLLIGANSSIQLTEVKAPTIVNSPGSTINTTNIVNKKGQPTIAPAPGTIGAKKELSAYISYLIKKYNDYASKDDTRKTKFSFGAISNNISNKFGVTWRNVSEERFFEVVGYLHSRISKTIIAKRNARMGRRAYRNFDDFLTDKYKR